MKDHAERVREFYRKQGEDRARAKAAHPSSFANIAFDTGVIAERQRIINIIKEEGSAAPAGWDSTDWLIALINGEDKSDCPADCRNCNLEDKPCKSCNEACLSCQEKFDPENKGEQA